MDKDPERSRRMRLAAEKHRYVHRSETPDDTRSAMAVLLRAFPGSQVVGPLERR